MSKRLRTCTYKTLQRPLDSFRVSLGCECLLIISTSLLSGSIHEELRSAGVWVVGLLLGKATGIDTLQGVYSFILGNLQRLFFFPPHICIKSTFRRFLLERKKYFRRLLAGLFAFFSFCFGVGFIFSRRYQALLEARFLLRRVTLCFIRGFSCGDMRPWRGWDGGRA